MIIRYTIIVKEPEICLRGVFAVSHRNGQAGVAKIFSGLAPSMVLDFICGMLAPALVLREFSSFMPST